MLSRPGGSRPRHHTLFALLAGVALLGPACSQSGSPHASGEVAGLPVTNFPSGLRDDAPAPDVSVRNVSDSEDDHIATAAGADVVDCWSGGSTSDIPMNAFYCPPADVIAWDRAQLLPMLHQEFGPMAIGTVLAHEYGHAIQSDLGSRAGISRDTKTIVREQQADCFAGNYM